MLICGSWIIWICCFSGLYKSIICQELPRIAGGKDANIKDFPSMAALIFKRNDKHFCGGSIISKVHVLTAAHCFEECSRHEKQNCIATSISTTYSVKLSVRKDHENGTIRRDGEEKHIVKSDEIYIRVGSTNWKRDGQIYDVDDRLRHPTFDLFGIKDIAIIKIKGQFIFSDTVKAIQIAPRSKVPSKGEVTLVGWGRIHYNITTSHEVLQMTEHEILSRRECQKYYYDITSSLICTNHRGKTSGACPGDSGGPVIFKGQIIGIIIAIYDDDCYTILGPNTHTKVIIYKKWIDKYMKGS